MKKIIICKNIFILLFLAVSLHAKPLKQKDDISCIIVDLKFDGKTVKILEFGRLEMSRLEGHEQLYGAGNVWKKLWHHISRFNLPIWYVGEAFTKDTTIRQFTYLQNINGSYHRNFTSVKKDPLFKKLTDKKIQKPRRIKYHKGIMVNKYHKGSQLKDLKKKHPDFIIANCRSVDYCANKQKASNLFNQTDLQAYKPAWGQYPATYTPTLANTILQDLQCDAVVIKPISSSKGRGIIITEKENLDATLQKIFTQKHTLQQEKDVAFSHWANYNKDIFLVESFEQSKPVYVQNKVYDGTMRVVVIMTHDNGRINIKPIGFYWKLPIKSLEQEGTLIDKHKSNIKKETQSSAKVCKKDRKKVTKIFKKIMPKLYRKMLESHF